ncbi:hypothetical protein [Streptomyces sp. enrichment culture]|uniref:hypothetical protein n=1 Tax=Streptomyces sp. enrichment culture TaxID=1795815 RepID=UPI003F562453
MDTTEQGDEPTVAEYQRADASRFPRTLAGQQAAAKGWTVPTDTATGRLAAQMLALIEQYEQERRAETATAEGVDVEPGGPLNRATLHRIAYRHATQTDSPSSRDRLLDDLAAEFTLADVRIIRGVAAAVADAMPRIAYRARQEGHSADKIAQATGYTTSRVNQFLREGRQHVTERLIRFAIQADAEQGGSPRASLAQYEAALAHVPEEHREAVEQYLDTLRAEVARHEQSRFEAHRAALPPGDTQYEWRIDLYDSPAGPGWQAVEAGTEQAAPGAAEQVAEFARRYTSSTADRYRSRVSVWEAPATPIDYDDPSTATYTHEQDPDQQ